MVFFTFSLKLGFHSTLRQITIQKVLVIFFSYFQNIIMFYEQLQYQMLR